jgi:hypothetical protein
VIIVCAFAAGVKSKLALLKITNANGPPTAQIEEMIACMARSYQA